MCVSFHIICHLPIENKSWKSAEPEERYGKTHIKKREEQKEYWPWNGFGNRGGHESEGHKETDGGADRYWRRRKKEYRGWERKRGVSRPRRRREGVGV